MELNVTYFYTVAIVDWVSLLQADKFKYIILESLRYLVEKNKVIVYGFVIMPNHIHIIWEFKELNGTEMPYASFMKFTGHEFLRELRNINSALLNRFKTDKNSRVHQF